MAVADADLDGHFDVSRRVITLVVGASGAAEDGSLPRSLHGSHRHHEAANNCHGGASGGYGFRGVGGDDGAERHGCSTASCEVDVVLFLAESSDSCSVKFRVAVVEAVGEIEEVDPVVAVIDLDDECDADTDFRLMVLLCGVLENVRLNECDDDGDNDAVVFSASDVFANALRICCWVVSVTFGSGQIAVGESPTT